jgi:hypothetical protein
MRYLIKVLVSRMGWAARVIPDSGQNTSVAASWSLNMRIHGVVWYFSAKTLLLSVLLYYFVGSNIVLWYLAGSAVFYALMATNVRKKPVIFTGYQRRRKCIIET